MSESASARHCLSVLVANEPGALARVVGLFSGRGYNIESLSVAEVDAVKNLSRITIITTGTASIVTQIQAQLARLVPVLHVINLSETGVWVERETALVKVAADNRAALLKLAAEHKAQAVDSNASPLIFHITDTPDNVSAFIEKLRPQGLLEIVRTGTLGIGADAKTL